MAPSFKPDPGQFFFLFIFPYLLVELMAYVGARVVYGLGPEVTRARELGSDRSVERLGQGGSRRIFSCAATGRTTTSSRFSILAS